MKKSVVKVFGTYKNQKVSGEVFNLGDCPYLLLDKKSTKTAKKEAIALDEVKGSYEKKVWVKVPPKPEPIYNAQGYDITQFVKLS